MKQFQIAPKIWEFNHCKDFCEEFQIGAEDLIFISQTNHERFFKSYTNGATVILRGNYPSGEPSDEMVEKIYQDIKDISYKRVIAIGGGTIIDTAKLFALKQFSPVLDLFDHKIEAVRDKELILVPTTCGTGSEVTNISILELKERFTKLGLASEALYPTHAVLIPELLQGLPFEFFATSSLDAFIHAVESYLSPKATSFTQMFSLEAVKMLLTGYKKIQTEGKAARFDCLQEFLLASTYAGIAFGNAGVGAVHAMSYPLGAKYHIPHGESNYSLFLGVLSTYNNSAPEGIIKTLNQHMANLLECSLENLYEELELLLNSILPRKPLSSYGVTKEDLISFTDNVQTKQGRLMANNYIPLTGDQVFTIYQSLF